MKRNIASGQGVIYSIFNGNKLTQKDVKSILNYANALKNGASVGQAWTENIGSCSVAAKQYVVDAKKAGKSTDELVEGLKNVPKATNLASIGLKALSVAGNMIAMWAITKGIELLVTSIDNYIHSAERATESLEETTNALADTSEEIENMKTQLSDLESNIENLQALSDAGTISVADEKQLELLKEENKELLTNIALLEDKQRKEAENAVKALGDSKNDYTYQYLDDSPTTTYTDSGIPITNNTPHWEFVKTSAADALEGYIKTYQDWKDTAQAENNQGYMDEALEGVNATINAYKELEKTKGGLDSTQQAEYDNALRVQQLYLEHIYAINGTESAYRALNQETQKKILNDRLLEQLGSDNQDYVNAILSAIDPEQYADLWNRDFSFTPPEMTDYATAEEYGKAYAEAWMNGLKVGTEGGQNPDEMSISYDTSEAISKLKELEDSMSDLDKTYASLLKGEKADLSSLDGIRESFAELENVDMNAVNEALESVANAETLEDAQDAMDALCTQYVKASGILDGLNESNKELIATQLKSIGVKNAEALVEERLAISAMTVKDAEDILASKKLSLIDVTYDEINALITEGEVSEVVGQQLAIFALRKQLTNDARIETETEVERILGLAKAAGIGSEALAKFTQFKEDLDNTDDAYTRSQIIRSINAYKQTLFAEIENVEVDWSPINYSGGSSTLSSTAKETVKTFNWIETAISRVQRAITNLGKVVGATYKKWSTRNNAIAQEFSTILKEIELQNNAYNGYLQKANSVGLSDFYKNLVHSGSLRIEDITNETLKNQISAYQEWYEKALSCSDAIEELKSNLADLAKTQVDNISSEYDNKMGEFDHQIEMLEGFIDQAEEAGYLASQKYYEALLESQGKNVTLLQSQYKDLIKSFNEGVESGAIEKYSETWYKNATLFSNK